MYHPTNNETVFRNYDLNTSRQPFFLLNKKKLFLMGVFVEQKSGDLKKKTKKMKEKTKNFKLWGLKIFLKVKITEIPQTREPA